MSTESDDDAPRRVDPAPDMVAPGHEAMDHDAMAHDALQRLSALVDGELDSAAARASCGHWRDDPEARRSWHAYQLIGDVLRSDDLACTSARDTAFLTALRIRLQAEPVVLAPQALQPLQPPEAPESLEPPESSHSLPGSARRGRRAWMVPSALAASFVVVAGVLVMNGLVTNGPPGSSTPVLTASELPRAEVPVDAIAARGQAVSATAAASEAQSPPVVADGALIRSARLDRYLIAHKQFAGSSALGLPSGFLRNATATESDR